MKKVLFTLAAVAFGLFASAQDKPGPVLKFGTDANNLVTEIELAPGDSTQLEVVLTEQQETVVMGFQLQWLMKNPSGELTEAVVGSNEIPDDPDFPMEYSWTLPMNLSTAVAAQGGIPGNALACSHPLFATWRWVGTNMQRNQFWWPRQTFTCPISVAKIALKANKDWTDEYATFEFDQDYYVLNQTPETKPASMQNYEIFSMPEMVLKIKNKNYVAPDQVEDPVINFAEENGVLTVTVSCATTGATLYVNGEAVEGNPYTYTVTQTDPYTEETVNVEAYAVNGTATSQTVKDSFTFQAQTQPVADKPVITFTEDGSGVMVTVENYTEYTIKVDGEQVAPTRNETNYYVDKVYDKTQLVEVYAKNAPGYPYIATEATDSYELAAKVKAQNSKPSVTYSYTNGELNVWAYGCTEDDVEYTLYCDGVEYNGTMPITVDPAQGYDHVWTATAVSPTTTVSELSDENHIVIDAVLPDYQTPKPTINAEEDDENQVVVITITGEGTVTARVDGVNYTDEDGDGKIVVEVPYGETENMINVYAAATANKPGYNVIPADDTQVVYIPAKPATPEQTAKPTIHQENDDATQTVTIIAVGDGTVILYNDDLEVARGEGRAEWTVPYSADPEGEEMGFSATAQEQDKLVSDYALYTAEIPGKPVTPTQQCAKPDGGYVNGQDFHGVTVTLTNNETAEGTQLHYTVKKDGAVITEDAIYDGPFALTQNGEYEIDFWATAPGMTDSTHGGLKFTIDETTGLSELAAGKNVASVRYFNMAGQEMQEANGMTIVVTTYTDGTSSAVKVMK